MLLRTALAALAALICATTAGAEAPPTRDWPALTLADVDAAHALLVENHPGAAPQMRDEAFRETLEAAWRLARERSSKVADYSGHAAVLRGFAGALGDRHLGWTPTEILPPVRYPGFWIVRRGADWAVIGQDDPAAPPRGARLVSCDGRSPDQLALERLAKYRADPSIAAQMTRAAPWLLLDDGNPFAPAPRVCRFESGGVERDHGLVWRSLDRRELSARAGALYPRATAGFGVRTLPTGTVWIAMEQLNAEASKVVGDVRARWPELGSAPVVVVDLRGNGGGDSSIGDDLARLLYGADAVAATRRGKAGCTAVWRASAGNLKTLESYQVRFADRGPEQITALRAETEAVRAAIAAGQPFNKAIDAACLVDKAAATVQPSARPAYAGKVVLITDGSCFSSCLLMVDRFRALGAVQAGQPTDAATWYMEVRSEPLPSGLGQFSVLGKAGLGAPRRLGPFAPGISFDGDMADTAALEAWIAKTF